MKTIVVAVCLLAAAQSVAAQGLKLEFNDGRVTLDATSVPVKTILAEWARLGGTKVTGAERITGGTPLTLRLENIPEAQALEIVLRNVAGYMAAPRQAASVGASAYDRILIMATSTTPPPAAAAGRAGGNAAGANGRTNPRAPFGGQQQAPQQEPEVAAGPPDEAELGVNEPAPFQFPQQNPFQAGQPGAFGTPMGQPGAAGQTPVISFGPQGSQGVSVNPSPEQQTPTLQFPGMPLPTQGGSGGFGVVGSPTPGVILQPPAQPGQPVRPPGGA